MLPRYKLLNTTLTGDITNNIRPQKSVSTINRITQTSSAIITSPVSIGISMILTAMVMCAVSYGYYWNPFAIPIDGVVAISGNFSAHGDVLAGPYSLRQLGTLSSTLETQFGTLETQFGSIGTQFNGLVVQNTLTQKHVETINETLHAITTAISFNNGTIDLNIDGLLQMFKDEINQDLEGLRIDVAQYVDNVGNTFLNITTTLGNKTLVIETRLDAVETRLNATESRLNIIEDTIVTQGDILSTHTGQIATQTGQIGTLTSGLGVVKATQDIMVARVLLVQQSLAGINFNATLPLDSSTIILNYINGTVQAVVTLQVQMAPALVTIETHTEQIAGLTAQDQVILTNLTSQQSQNSQNTATNLVQSEQISALGERTTNLETFQTSATLQFLYIISNFTDVRQLIANNNGTLTVLIGTMRIEVDLLKSQMLVIQGQTATLITQMTNVLTNLTSQQSQNSQNTATNLLQTGQIAANTAQISANTGQIATNTAGVSLCTQKVQTLEAVNAAQNATIIALQATIDSLNATLFTTNRQRTFFGTLGISDPPSLTIPHSFIKAPPFSAVFCAFQTTAAGSLKPITHVAGSFTVESTNNGDNGLAISCIVSNAP